MRAINFSWALILCTCVLFVGPAGLVYAHHCKGGHANDPGCDGGGDPPGGNDFPVDLEFRDGVIDGIQSDIVAFPDPGYVDGESGVRARIQDNGILLINIVEPRALIFDFSNQTRAPACAPADCKREENIVMVSGVAVSLRVVADADPSVHLPGNLLGMDVNEMFNGEMKLGYGGPGKAPRFSVRFRSPEPGEPIDAFIATDSTFVEITRTSQTTWFIEAVEGSDPNAPGDQALLFSKFKDRGQVTQDEGAYKMPFGLEVTCPTCP